MQTTRAFTLTEILLSIAVLALLILLTARLVNNTTTIVGLSSKRMDLNSEVRPLFNRIAADFGQMIKRNDVTYYAKTTGNAELGNDTIAFFSLVDGYYPNTTGIAEVEQPQTTVIAYRVNSQFQFERIAKSLPFAGQASPTPMPALTFGSTASPIWSTFPTTVDLAASPTPEPDANVIGAEVFRFEYYYLIRADGSASTGSWPSMPEVKMTDVAAIAVTIAMIDPKSRKLLAQTDIATLAGAMNDYDPSMGTNGLIQQWQTVLDNSTLPRAALAGIRFYQRIFPL